MGTAASAQLDELLSEYKAAVDAWIAAIRDEESLALPDHSMRDWDTWERAGIHEETVRATAVKARKAYEDALRKSLLNF